jgi:hypothetical protein
MSAFKTIIGNLRSIARRRTYPALALVVSVLRDLPKSHKWMVREEGWSVNGCDGFPRMLFV